MNKVIYEGYGVREDGMITNAFGVAVEESLDKGGYKMIHIPRAGRYGLRKARFVYEAFNGKIEDDMQVDHIDGDRTNDSIHNLQLLTPQQNSLKAWQDTPDRVLLQTDILQLSLAGDVVAVYASMREAAREIGGCHRRIGEVINGKKDTHRGYKWARGDK